VCHIACICYSLSFMMRVKLSCVDEWSVYIIQRLAASGLFCLFYYAFFRSLVHACTFMHPSPLPTPPVCAGASPAAVDTHGCILLNPKTDSTLRYSLQYTPFQSATAVPGRILNHPGSSRTAALTSNLTCRSHAFHVAQVNRLDATMTVLHGTDGQFTW
jgi:hypothetical protein